MRGLVLLNRQSRAFRPQVRRFCVGKTEDKCHRGATEGDAALKKALERNASKPLNEQVQDSCTTEATEGDEALQRALKNQNAGPITEQINPRNDAFEI